MQGFFFGVKTKRPNLLRFPQIRTTRALQAETSKVLSFFLSSLLMQADTNKLQLCCAATRAGVTHRTDEATRFELLL